MAAEADAGRDEVNRVRSRVCQKLLNSFFYELDENKIRMRKYKQVIITNDEEGVNVETLFEVLWLQAIPSSELLPGTRQINHISASIYRILRTILARPKRLVQYVSDSVNIVSPHNRFKCNTSLTR